MTGRRLLMVAMWYPPCEAWPTAATRASLFSRHLAASGWDPLVLVPDLAGGACSCRSCRGRAVGGNVDDPSGVTVRREPVRPSLPRRALRRLRDGAGDPPPADRTSAGTVARQPSALAHLTNAARDLAWLVNGTNSDWPAKAASRARQIVDEEAPVAVWTTSGPFEHLPIGRALKADFGLPWIADIRDPASVDVTARSPWVERLVRTRRARYRRDLLAADAVIAATGQVAMKDGPWLGKPLEVLVTGFDSDDWAAARRKARAGERFEIVFTGLLYENYRRPDVFLKGLRRFANSLPTLERAGVRFVYYGRSGSLLRRLARENGCEDLIDDAGFIAPTGVPPVLAEATILLLLTNEGGDSGVPGGKFFEYLGAHRPVLAVPGTDEFIRDVFAETGAGMLVNDEEQVAAQLARWHAEWKATGSLPFAGDPTAIERFSSRASAQRLAALLDDLVPTGSRTGERTTGAGP